MTLEPEEWQLEELRAGIAEIEAGQEVSHEQVKEWLNSWGKSLETEPPAA
jgi:predicted transcriptional regulator